MKRFNRAIQLILALACLSALICSTAYAEFHWNPVDYFNGDKADKKAPAKQQTAPVKSKSVKSDSSKTAVNTKPTGKKPVARATTLDPRQAAAVLMTQRGDITFELLYDDAPKTVTNFVQLVSRDFYAKPNMKFHRVEPGFVVQTGDPTGTGYGGAEKTIPLEVKNKLVHNDRGWVGMARGAGPNTATSQFYITLAPSKHLDGKYAIFGRVIAGRDALDKIQKDDHVYGVKLVPVATVIRDREDKKSWKDSMIDALGGKAY